MQKEDDMVIDTNKGPIIKNKNYNDPQATNEMESYIRKLKQLNIENERLKRIIQDYEKRIQEYTQFPYNDKDTDQINLELKKFKGLTNQKSLEVEEWKSRYHEQYLNLEAVNKELQTQLINKENDTNEIFNSKIDNLNEQLLQIQSMNRTLNDKVDSLTFEKKEINVKYENLLKKTNQ